MTGGGDRGAERRIHDDVRGDLLLIEGERDFLQSIFDLQFRARNEWYGAMFPDALYYMVEKLGDTIGRLVIDASRDRIHIVDIALVPSWHNQGIGSTIVEAIQTVAARLPAPVGLSVRRDRPATVALYQRLGFVPDGQPDPLALHISMIWRPRTGSTERSLFVP